MSVVAYARSSRAVAFLSYSIPAITRILGVCLTERKGRRPHMRAQRSTRTDDLDKNDIV
jgi:hypothetical protein